MRCASCGFPLSPTRTHCPKCGTASTGSEKHHEQTFNQAEGPQYAFPSQQSGNGFIGAQGNFEVPQQQWMSQSSAGTLAGQNAQGLPFMQQASPVYQPAGNEMPLPTQFPSLPTQSSSQAGQFSPVGGVPQAEFPPGWQSASQPGQRRVAPDQANQGAFPQFPQPPRKSVGSNGRHSARLRFTIAGLCVLMGGLILMFVYIISLSLPPVPVGSPSMQAAASTATAQGFSPTTQSSALSATATSQVTPAVTPTMSLPGQQYIDNAQMASSVNPNTAQATQLAHDFKVKQPIFVTFMLHPQNGGGAVCLLWYLNEKQFSHFAFLVDPTPQSAYSYAYAGSPGSGSVEVYWASTTACVDKELAQVVNFTVNAS